MHISKVDLLGWIIYSMHKNIRTSILLYEIILPPYILHIYFCTASYITYTFHANTIQSTNSFWSSPLLALHTHLELHDSAAYLSWTPWTHYLRYQCTFNQSLHCKQILMIPVCIDKIHCTPFMSGSYIKLVSFNLRFNNIQPHRTHTQRKDTQPQNTCRWT